MDRDAFMLKQISQYAYISKVELLAFENRWDVDSIDLAPSVSMTNSQDFHPVLANMKVSNVVLFDRLENSQAHESQLPYVEILIHRKDVPDYPFKIEEGYITNILYNVDTYINGEANISVLGRYRADEPAIEHILSNNQITVISSLWVPRQIKEKEKKDKSLKRFRLVLEESSR